jgi:hypothetical protein
MRDKPSDPITAQGIRLVRADANAPPIRGLIQA